MDVRGGLGGVRISQLPWIPRETERNLSLRSPAGEWTAAPSTRSKVKLDINHATLEQALTHFYLQVRRDGRENGRDQSGRSSRKRRVLAPSPRRVAQYPAVKDQR